MKDFGDAPYASGHNRCATRQRFREQWVRALALAHEKAYVCRIEPLPQFFVGPFARQTDSIMQIELANQGLKFSSVRALRQEYKVLIPGAAEQ